MVKIVKDFPPNIAKITRVFPRLPETVCFTYGDTIYFPNGETLSDDLVEHESVHIDQQKELGAERWWDKYLDDKEFRLAQEVEAYAKQYICVKKTRKEKIAKRYLEMFAHHLSTIYGLDITESQAYTIIRKRCLLINTVV